MNRKPGAWKNKCEDQKPKKIKIISENCKKFKNYNRRNNIIKKFSILV